MPRSTKKPVEPKGGIKMRKLLAFTAAFLLTAGAAHAERYVMVTHTQGTDPFWPVVEKGAKDAAKALGVELEYNYAPSGDMADMAKLIESATATKPDGLIVSLPDARALGGAIKAAVAARIPARTPHHGLAASA